MKRLLLAAIVVALAHNAGNVLKQGARQERQAAGWCGIKQLPQKMQTPDMLAKGGERGRQEALRRRQEQLHAEMYEERLRR